VAPARREDLNSPSDTCYHRNADLQALRTVSTSAVQRLRVDQASVAAESVPGQLARGRAATSRRFAPASTNADSSWLNRFHGIDSTMMRRSTLDDGETGAARRLEVHKVTIHDVAAAAGVSSGTASRVLSGHPSTSPESRKRVTEAAHRLGYRPNARARSLRKAHTDTIGLLIPDVRNPFFAEIAHNAEQAALRHALSTLLCNEPVPVRI